MVEKLTDVTSTERSEDADKASPSPVAHSHASNAESSNTSYSSYLFGRAGESAKPLLSDSTGGRAFIRFISRGIVGAVAMTMVDRIARRQLDNYVPEAIKGFTGPQGWLKANASQKIAKVYDVAAGKPIEAFMRAVAPAGRNAEGVLWKEVYAKNATTFRQKAYYHSKAGFMPGRSLGAEIVSVTASFAAGSLGDAGTRNIIQVIDPNNAKSWMLNDKGEVAKQGEKKHFDFGRWAAATARTSWRVVSKNMGEDWAVALPYVYQMRWQRTLIAKNNPDAKLVFDNGLNGGSTHIDQKGNVIGDFQWAGALDLHTRFVGYNWFTLMYREAYDNIGRSLQGWKDNGFKLQVQLPANPIASAVDTVGYTARYVAKSFIKANLYMNPAVIPFWMMRVPQSKWRSPLIVAQQGEMHNAFPQMHPPEAGSRPILHDALGSPRHAYSATGGAYLQTSKVEGGRMFKEGPKSGPGKAGWLPTNEFEGTKPWSVGMAKKLINADMPRGLFSAALMPFGWLSYQAGSGVVNLSNKMFKQGRIANYLDSAPGIGMMGGRERFLREMVDNSLSYTPYMIAKAETALRVDERPANGGLGAMDKAIYKFIDSTVRFDLKNAGAALGDIGSNALDMGREVKMREGGEGAEVAVKQKTPMAPEDRPSVRVQAQSVKRDPNARERASDHVANDNEHSSNDNAPDKNWAETVTGQALEGRFQNGSHSIH